MKESHTKGLASHGNPEACAGTREDTSEALTGAHTGGVSSRENRCARSGRSHVRRLEMRFWCPQIA